MSAAPLPAAVRLPLREIKPNPDNPRVIRDEQFTRLVASLKSFPEMLALRPIVVNADRVVLGGNMRLRAAKEAGLKEVPVVIADQLTPEQQREFIVKDNASFGAWDWDVLANEWGDLPLADWGVDVPSFDAEAVAMPDLPTAMDKTIEQMTFTVTADQADTIREAVAVAISAGPFVDTGNENKNGNALARLAEVALGHFR
jgi:hypothetical protein